MSGRFQMKVSKFRNIIPQEFKKENWYPDLRPSGSMDATGVACSGEYLAVNWATNAGGAVALLPIHSPGKRSGDPKMLHAHQNPIVDFAFSPFDDTVLATSSEDATVKLWRLPAEDNFKSAEPQPLCTLRAHKRKVDAISFHPCTSGVLASVSTDKTVKIWDIETGEPKISSAEFPEPIISAGWNYAGCLLATTSKDKKLRIHDPRATTPVVGECVCHEGVKPTRLTWMGRHNFVLTTGFDKQQGRQFAIWDLRSLGKPMKLKNLDSSSGICTPLYDGDTNLFFLCGKGDGAVKVFEGCEGEPWYMETTNLPSDVQSKGICLLPKRCMRVMSQEIDVLFKLSGNSVIPIGLYVPRKKKVYEAELYPDTASLTPSLTTADWFGGMTKDPTLMSMAPKGEQAEEQEPEPEPAPKPASVARQPAPASAQKAASPTPTSSSPTPQTEHSSETTTKSPSPIASPVASPPTSPMPQKKASMNIVRYSKFRNISGKPFMKNSFYENLRVNTNLPNTLVKVNPQFFAVPWQGPGGRLAIWPVSKIGKLPTEVNWLEHGNELAEFECHPFNDHIFITGGEDARIKIWTVPDGGLTEILKQPTQDLLGHTRRICYLSCHPTANNTLISSAMDLTVKLWDIEKAEVARDLIGHTDMVMNTSWDWPGAVMASSCKDKILRLWDPRKPAVATEGAAVDGVKGFNVAWCGKKDKLFTVGFTKSSERQWSLWDIRDLSKPISRNSIDAGAGALRPYYDPDTNVVMTFARGDSTFRFFEVNDEAPCCHFLTEFTTTPSAGVDLLPKTSCDVKNCEIIQLIRLSGVPPATAERLSFLVPRQRMEFFQDDIFPPTRSREPALSAADWFSGGIKESPTVSLQPNGMVPLSQAPAEDKGPAKYRLLTDAERETQKEVTRDDVFNKFYGRMQDFKEDETVKQTEDKRKKEESDGWAVKEDEWD